MKTSIVIPNFNGKDLLKNNLPQIILHCPESEILVVDDCSSDQSVTMLKKNFPNIRIIKHQKNLGFASSVNDGVKHAKGDLIILLNTDVVPVNNFIDEIVSLFKNPQIFAVGFAQKCIENGQLIYRGRGIGRFTKGFLFHKKGDVNKNNTLWVSGGAGIFRKYIWEKLGGLNPVYNPFYWEDIDLSYRALKSGYRIVFEKRGIVSHTQEQGSIRNSYSAEKIKQIAYRNQIFFVWLNISDINYLIQHLIYLPYHLLKALISFDLAFVVALYLALKELPKILIFRRRNKKLTVVSDKEVLQSYY